MATPPEIFAPCKRCLAIKKFKLRGSREYQCERCGKLCNLEEFETYTLPPDRKNIEKDAAFPERKIAVEIDGGVFVSGRHTRGVGFMKDCEKMNMAALLGWRVFRFVPQQLEGGEVYDVLEKALLIREAS